MAKGGENEMKIEDFDRSVAVAQLDFQGEARGWGNLPSGVSAYLRTEAFPLNAPPSLRSARDYGGLKLFSYQAHSICVAYFYDGGKTDEFQRAVPSASVLIFDRALYHGGFRNLPALRDFLLDIAQNPGEEADARAALRSLHEEAAITGSAEALQSFLTGLRIDTNLLAAAQGLLAVHHQLRICAPTHAVGQAFLAALFAMAPAEFLEYASWCTYVNSMSGRYEEVVVLLCQLEAEKEKSWLDQVKNRFVVEKPVEPGVDSGNRIVQGPSRKTPNQRVAEQLLAALVENELQLFQSFPDRFTMFLALLGACCRDTPVTLSALPPGLALPDTAKRLEAYLKQALHS